MPFYLYHHCQIKRHGTKNRKKEQVGPYIKTHLHSKGPENDGAKDGIGKYPIKDVSLSVDLASIDLIEKLHEDEGVENDGVVLRGRGVERSIATAVDVKHALAWGSKRGID